MAIPENEFQIVHVVSLKSLPTAVDHPAGVVINWFVENLFVWGKLKRVFDLINKHDLYRPSVCIFTVIKFYDLKLGVNSWFFAAQPLDLTGIGQIYTLCLVKN
jgi:hypothetical protein